MNDQFILELDKSIEDIQAEGIMKSRQQNSYVVIGSIKSSEYEDIGFVKCRWCYAIRKWEVVLIGYVGNISPKEVKISYSTDKLTTALGKLDVGLNKYIQEYNKEIHLIEA